MERVSARVYGGKCMCGMLAWWRRCGCRVVAMRMVVRLDSCGSSAVESYGFLRYRAHTVSPSRAIAGSKVGAASR